MSARCAQAAMDGCACANAIMRFRHTTSRLYVRRTRTDCLIRSRHSHLARSPARDRDLPHKAADRRAARRGDEHARLRSPKVGDLRSSGASPPRRSPPVRWHVQAYPVHQRACRVDKTGAFPVDLCRLLCNLAEHCGEVVIMPPRRKPRGQSGVVGVGPGSDYMYFFIA